MPVLFLSEWPLFRCCEGKKGPPYALCDPTLLACFSILANKGGDLAIVAWKEVCTERCNISQAMRHPGPSLSGKIKAVLSDQGRPYDGICYVQCEPLWETAHEFWEITLHNKVGSLPVVKMRG